MKAAATILVLTSLAAQAVAQQTRAWQTMKCGNVDWSKDWGKENCYDVNNECFRPKECWNMLWTRWCKCPHFSTRLECQEESSCKA